MVTEFPIFSRVTLEDKPFFDDFNAQFPPYADWAFGTLMTWWDAFNDLKVSQLGGNLVIQSSYLTMGKAPQFTLLGNHNVDGALETLFEYLRKDNKTPELYSLPQYTVEAITNPTPYIIIEDPNSAEYISSIASHVALEGKGLYHMRRAVHHFERIMSERVVDITNISLSTLQAKMMLINALHTWQGIYGNDRERLEGSIIDRSLLIAEYIDLQSLCIFIDKKLAGFALYKPLSQDYANINHIKVSREYPDLFRYLTHTIACVLQRSGYTYLNGEQDLGIEGLRRYKTSLQPIAKFHKYSIRPND
jgi:hypothetical protein